MNASFCPRSDTNKVAPVRRWCAGKRPWWRFGHDRRTYAQPPRTSDKASLFGLLRHSVDSIAHSQLGCGVLVVSVAIAGCVGCFGCVGRLCRRLCSRCKGASRRVGLSVVRRRGVIKVEQRVAAQRILCSRARPPAPRGIWRLEQATLPRTVQRADVLPSCLRSSLCISSHGHHEPRKAPGSNACFRLLAGAFLAVTDVFRPPGCCHNHAPTVRGGSRRLSSLIRVALTSHPLS